MRTNEKRLTAKPCHILLCDGMGTGGRAAVDGAMASGLMARLLKTGFGYNCSLKILNSSIMEFYIEKTSYTISGNYKCYQKKNLKNFSIPPLSPENIDFINKHDGEELNCYLEKLYYYNA